MANLGAPRRKDEPLHVIAMAIALVVAAIVGAGLGFLIDAGTRDEPQTSTDR